MKKHLLIFLILSYLPLFGQVNNYTKGKVIDSILISNNSKESYALYLPYKFNSNELTPIIFIFDPVARGKIGINPFIKAAEKYNYILVCSNNSKNGPFERNFEIANRLFEKVFSDFNINPKRVYTAGFSGGARLASTIAVLTDQIQGVIACGASLSKNKGHLPYKNNFSYAGIIGDEDMNYKEMHNNKGFLDRLKISNELFVFEFNHKWPSQEQISKAMDWLQLEAYRKQLVKIDTNNIKEIYLNHYKYTKELKENNELLKTSYELERIIKNFDKYFNLDSVTNRLTKLQNNKFYKKQKKEVISNFRNEVIMTDKFIDKFNNDFNKNTTDIKWWLREISKLKKSISSSKSVNQKKMLKRLEYKIFALAIETASYGNKITNIKQAIFCYDICLLIYPKSYFLYFKQAENYINKNEPEIALNYLEKLLNAGYQNKKYLKEHKAFQSVKDNQRFINLIKN